MSLFVCETSSYVNYSLIGLTLLHFLFVAVMCWTTRGRYRQRTQSSDDRTKDPEPHRTSPERGQPAGGLHQAHRCVCVCVCVFVCVCVCCVCARERERERERDSLCVIHDPLSLTTSHSHTHTSDIFTVGLILENIYTVFTVDVTSGNNLSA